MLTTLLVVFTVVVGVAHAGPECIDEPDSIAASALPTSTAAKLSTEPTATVDVAASFLSAQQAKTDNIRGLRLMFLGAPGVGKGTYAQRLSQAVDTPFLSSGDLLRAEVAAGSHIGVQVKKLMDAGQFVDDALIETMVLGALRHHANSGGAGGFLLDGFPRNLAQAKSIEAKGLQLDWAVNLRQPHSVIVTKLSSRRVCPQCGFTYNVASINESGIVMEPLHPHVHGHCDHCGFVGELATRPDDAKETVVARLAKYDRDTKPLEEYYAAQGKLVTFDVLGGAKTYLPKLMDLLAPLKRRS